MIRWVCIDSNYNGLCSFVKFNYFDQQKEHSFQFLDLVIVTLRVPKTNLACLDYCSLQHWSNMLCSVQLINSIVTYCTCFVNCPFRDKTLNQSSLEPLINTVQTHYITVIFLQNTQNRYTHSGRYEGSSLTSKYDLCFNSFSPGRFEWNFRLSIFSIILVINGWAIFEQLPSNGCHWTLLKIIQIGSGNGLVLSGNKPLPEPMLTQINVAIGHH